jgi:hypothetical protein
MRKLIGLWCRLIFGFSVWPLHVGVFLWVTAFAAVLAKSLIPGSERLTKLTELALAGTTGLLLAIVGEYAGRLYMLANAAAQFVIKRQSRRATVSLACYRSSPEEKSEHAAV